MSDRFFIRSQCFACVGVCMCVPFQVPLSLFLHASAVMTNLTDMPTLHSFFLLFLPCLLWWYVSLCLYLSCSFGFLCLLDPLQRPDPWLCFFLVLFFLFPSLLLFYQLLCDHTEAIPGDETWPVIGQFSSIGSMGLDKTKWLAGEFQRTMTTLGKSSVRSDPPMHLVRADSAIWLRLWCGVRVPHKR